MDGRQKAAVGFDAWSTSKAPASDAKKDPKPDHSTPDPTIGERGRS